MSTRHLHHHRHYQPIHCQIDLLQPPDCMCQTALHLIKHWIALKPHEHHLHILISDSPHDGRDFQELDCMRQTALHLIHPHSHQQHHHSHHYCHQWQEPDCMRQTALHYSLATSRSTEATEALIRWAGKDTSAQ